MLLFFRLFLGIQQLLKLHHEGLNILKLTVDRGETDIRNLVKLLKAIHDQETNLIAGHFLLHLAAYAAFYAANEILDFLKRNRALFASLENTISDLCRIKLLAALILFHDKDGQHFNLFIGREPSLAALTLAAAADGAVLSRAGINNAALRTITIYALHKRICPLYSDVSIFYIITAPCSSVNIQIYTQRNLYRQTADETRITSSPTQAT